MPSRIEWTDETWNTVIGCTKCSPACDNCYAARMALRLGSNPATPQYKGLSVMGESGPDWTGEVRCLPEALGMPLRWRKPRRIFVGSMCDLFHPAVPFDFLDRIFAVMALAQWHTFCLLTKRPGRMREYLDRGGRDWWKQRLMDTIVANFREHNEQVYNYPSSGAFSWPLPNVWLGTTIWDQDSADKNVPGLLQCPAVVRYVSVEPMLGPVTFRWAKWSPTRSAPVEDHLDGMRCLSWVIVGAETGPGRRPMKLEWARSLRDECNYSKVPFFFKKDSSGSRDVDGQTWEEVPG